MTAGADTSITTEYFNYLYYQVLRIRDIRSPLSYVNVCKIMHDMKFDDSCPNDDNRARDGLELRDEFLSTRKEVEIEEFTELQSIGACSVFEMLVALTRRADYIVEWGWETWFKVFLENLDLWKYSDQAFSRRDGLKVTEIVTKFNNRQYSRSGNGGIFPLRRGRRDQRSIEIWYQMSAYMTENRLY